MNTDPYMVIQSLEKEHLYYTNKGFKIQSETFTDQSGMKRTILKHKDNSTYYN
ncbi:hypothetical protein PEPS_47170 (plasmid) [Persicobacter psychrovividus]|uniref:Uncharacterized protein n=1 Tax=Persicobacter psychrovividus TaxID=387638 RepID=A0ABN6LH78_9BACT|nr:hypothetical protein PEPS_47170 [Persicobacter psychrovividus]